MTVAKIDDTVKIQYVGTLEDGKVFDQSKDEAPLQFILGKNQVIPGFEQAVLEMSVGQSKTVTLSPEEGYGPYREDLTQVMDRSDLPDHITPQVGQALVAKGPEGQELNITIKALDEQSVTLDANHPLAGKDLTFEITLVEIVSQ